MSEYQLSGDRKRNSRSCGDVGAVNENARPSLLCRVSLPDSSSTMGSLVPGKSFRIWVERLLRRRGFVCCEFVVLDLESGVALNIDRDCSRLANREIMVKYVSENESYPTLGSNDTFNFCQISDPKTSTETADMKADYSSLSRLVTTAASASMSCQLDITDSLEAKRKEEKDDTCYFDNDGLEAEDEGSWRR